MGTKAYFSGNGRVKKSLELLRHFHDWSLGGITADLPYFFNSLASNLREAFDAQLVTIWDNNSHNACLVLQASVPERESTLASHTIPTERCLTGAAVTRKDVVLHREILKSSSSRRFVNPAIAEEFRLARMLSVPIFRPSEDGDTLAIFNLYFDSEHGLVSPISKEDLKRVASQLGRCLQYLIYRRDEEITGEIQTLAASATGIPSLLDGAMGPLANYTGCGSASLFTWDARKRELLLERSARSYAEDAQYPQLKLSKGNAAIKQELIKTCVEAARPMSTRDGVSRDRFGLYPDPDIVVSTLMATPIMSAEGHVLGVLACEGPRSGRKSLSFSSLDLHALETFSRALAPSVERYVRVRGGTGLMGIVRDVSDSMLQAYQIDMSLQNTIETLVSALQSRYGSIYLLDEDSRVLTMRAATQPSKHLVGKATYKIGEGVTGSIAHGRLLNFRSREEIRSFPAWAGKYRDEVWGQGSTEDSDTILGIPIVIGGKVLGVWKVENVQAVEAHPDSYYTDDDVQVAQVLSFFLAYAIQNSRQEDKLLQQFTSLASTIQVRPSDDREAMSSVLIALESIGFAGALVCLYDQTSRTLRPELSSGSSWTKLSETPECRLEDDDIRAAALRANEDIFVPDSREDPRCSHGLPTSNRLRAQYVVPLKLEDELIGTLQVDLGTRTWLPDDERLILRAFGGHLAVAISRARSIRQAVELTSHVMASSRFITAETLSSMAVHSLHHRLKDFNKQLEAELNRREVKQNEFARVLLSGWRERLSELETDLKKILAFVRAPVSDADLAAIDVHPEVQSSITTWINYITNHKCIVQRTLDAARSTCDMTPEALKEIISVLLVNAVQAHAKRISIRTYNATDVITSNRGKIRSAFCLECSDDGDGLSTNKPEEIFEATYTTKNKHLGTGLGLFVARRLARDAGGDLEVVGDDHKQKGAAFRLSLPLWEA
jgi:GAF domain-containing protein